MERVGKKICSRCHIEKDIEEFGKDKNRKDGHYCFCKLCTKEIATIYRLKYPNKVKAYNDKYRLENLEQVKTYKAKYRLEHFVQTRTASARWRKKHPEQVRLIEAASGHKRRAAGSISSTDFKKIEEFSNGICLYCLEPIEVGHHDHVVPIDSGGRSEVGNYAWVCAKCNLNKHTKDLEVFLAEQTALGRKMQSFDRICIYGRSYLLTIQPKYDIVLLT